MNDDWEQWPPIEGNDSGSGFLIFILVMIIILGTIFLFFDVKGKLNV